MQKITQTLIRWVPSGVGLGATVHSALNQEWTRAIALSFITACLSLWVRFSGKFMETLEEAAAQRGADSAQWMIKAADRFTLAIVSNFQSRYYQSLVYALRDFRTQGLKTKGPFALNLEKVFVPLQLAPETADKISSAMIAVRNARENLTIWDFLARLSEQPTFRRIVVLGPPGSGKSTLLEHLALAYAQNKQPRQHAKAPALIPVLLYLRDVQDAILVRGIADTDAPPTLAALIQQQSAIQKLKPPEDWFEIRLQQGKCLILLDGLDEVADMTRRQQVSRWIDEQMLNYPTTAFIVTSRPFGYRSAPLGQVGLVAEVQPFTLKQVEQFINNWYLQNEIMSRLGKDDPGVRQVAQQQSSDLFNRIKHNPALASMALNPLLLTMIATVHCYQGALPGRRVQLYAEICDVLLGRRQDAKGMVQFLTAAQKKLVLQVLALKRMQKKTREFKKVTGCILIREKLTSVAGDGADPEEFLEQIENISGLLVQRQPDVYEFVHKSFQEYLAAAQIKESKQEFLLTHSIDDPWWDETIRLYAAQGDASNLIWAALDQPSVVSLTLAYDCLEEGLSVQPDVRRQLEETLESGLESTDAEIFKLAAEVKLSRRLNRLLRIDDTTEIDTCYITCAEYQLFIDEKRVSGEDCQPDHWQTAKFPAGDAMKPITGVRASDAEEFCEWLTQRSSPLGDTFLEGSSSVFVGEARFRLPKGAEMQEHPLSVNQVGCWCNVGDRQLIVGIDPDQWQRWQNELAEIVGSDRHLTRELNRALNRNNYKTLHSSSPLNLLYQALSFTAHSDLDLNLDLDFARSRIIDFESDFETEPAISLEQGLVYLISLVRDRTRSLNYDFTIQRNYDLSQLRAYTLLTSALFKLISEAYDRAARNRGLLPTQKPTRKDCEDLSREYLNKSSEAFNLYAFFVLIDQRRAGQFPAWESIRIVKQKTNS
ncbi:MAG: NACHT domain-containing protein [Leptolyngbyaceae cyanobacterium SM1_4_3]|nr:NACHT domain-containing protein [Leptolyngbyaceae cyanobacterium SM1_4_3]